MKTLATLGIGALLAWLFLPASAVIAEPKPAPSPRRRDHGVSFLGGLNRQLLAALIVISALVSGGTVYTAYAHNGVNHTSPSYASAARAAYECASAYPKATLPVLIETGRMASGHPTYILDRTTTLRDGLASNKCQVDRARLYNAIAAAEEGLPGHWDDEVRMTTASYDAANREMARLLNQTYYQVTNNPNLPRDIMGIPTPFDPSCQYCGNWTEGVDRLSPTDRELTFVRLGWLDLADLALIGAALD